MKKRISLLLALCMLFTVVPFSNIFASAATGVDVQYWACDNGSLTTYVDDSPSFSSANFAEGSASLALEAAEKGLTDLKQSGIEGMVTKLTDLQAMETKMIGIKATHTPTDGFVIDGKLDEYYIKEDASGNLYYFNHDMIDAWVSDGGWDPYYGVTDHGFEIYTAYDDDYLYFYARAFDTTLTKIENDPNRNDSIALYLDPDPTSWYNSANPDNGGFYFHTDDGNQGDMKFRLHGYDLSLDDMSPNSKTCLGNDTIANWLANANNFKSFYFDDDEDGNNDGYGFEVRIPRVEDNGTYTYNFACGSYKENYADQYTWSLGRSWWIDYNSMAVVEYADTNPFLNQGYVDPLLAAAKAVDELIKKIPAELTAENYDQYVAATEAAREAFDALELAAKILMKEQAALETAERIIKNYVPEELAKRGDINMDDSVNAVDALLVLQAAVGKATLTDKQTAMADLNGDTKIDAVDALAILKIAVGKE